MFDVGFSEIVVIGVVALIVIGPERLPKTARMLGHLFGRLQRYVNEVKADINKEMELDELRRLKDEVQGATRDLQQSVSSAATEVQSTLRSVETQLNPPPETPAAPAEAPTALPPLAEPPAAPVTEAAPPKGPAEPPPRQSSLPGFDQI